MQILEEKFPNGGLNRDDDERYLSDNESRFILNMRSGASEGSNVGSIENIKGTTEVTFDMPLGVNKVIGSYGDQTTHTNFFFLWNSLGQHTIYRYFPESRTVRILLRGSELGFTEYDLINDIRVVDEKLLKWRDVNNPPRKININKSDSDNPDFRQIFNWYLGDKYILQTTLDVDVTIRSKKYNTPFFNGTLTVNVNQILDKFELAKDISNQLNAITSIGSQPVSWKAESCGEFVVINITNSDFYSFVAKDKSQAPFDNITAQIVPQNHYQSFVERTIDEIKHPPHCELKSNIKSDENFDRNYVEGMVFQFAARYIYDDDERSTINPYSINAYNKITCEDLGGANIDNYYEIDFSVFPEINEVSEVQTIKRLELFVRSVDKSTGEQGLWKSIKTLEQYEFIDISNQHYDFYNDGLYSVTNVDNFIRPFDKVPIRTKNMEVVKNRTFFGNNLEGYDNICVDANIDVEYNDIEENIVKKTYDISGSIAINSLFNPANNQSGYKSQPIWQKTQGGFENSETVWGGMSRDGIKKMEQVSGQTLPLDGFTVYLTGTNFVDVSRQKPADSQFLDNTLSQNANNVYIVEDNGEDNLRDLMEKVTAVQSTFTIKNVPNGWYMLRVASHLTTQSDLDSGNLDYQKTSTNVYKIRNTTYIPTLINPNPPIPPHKSMIEGTNELLVYVDNGNIGGVLIDIMDLTNDDRQGSTKIMSGYVVDHDIDDPITTYDEFLGDTRIPRARVSFSLPFDDKNITNPNRDEIFGSELVDGKLKGYTTTDHNGFFFYASAKGDISNSLLITIGNFLFNSNSLFITKIIANDLGGLLLPNVNYFGNLVASGLGSGKVGGVEENEWTIIANRSPKGNSFNARTKVKGSVLDSNNLGIPRASIVSSRTETNFADNNGVYEFWHYAILQKPLINFETFLFPTITGNSCSAFYDNNQFYDYDFDYPSWLATLGFTPNNAITTSPTLILDIPSFEGDTSALFVVNAMKRGWDGEFGIIYQDRGNRSGAVNTIEPLKIHIPFYTEKDTDGLQKKGVPVLNWKIKHTPPEWATHYQWVRTRNLKVGSYFQWSVGDVKYTDAQGNPANNINGTRISLDIENLSIYKEKYPSMDLQATIDNESWRVRFIKNSDGLLKEYIDKKVLEVDGSNIIIENDLSLGKIEDGVLVEFYSELLNIETNFFFEFGECYEVGTDSNGNKFHKGLTTDQDPINPLLSPATGTFKTGDAYYRLREMPNTTVNNPAYIDDDAVSDFFFSEVESIGRPNAINSDAKQIWKPSQIRHSGRYNPDIAINDLSQFKDDDFKLLPLEYGDIYKLQLASNVLLSIHEFRWVSNYIEEAIVRKQGGTDELVASTDVFGSFRAAPQITGTVNQESVDEFRGNVWAFDINKGLVNRWGSDGLTPISEQKMIDYFLDKSQDILNNSYRSIVPVRILGQYDIRFKEYILSFGELYKLSSSEDIVQPPLPKSAITLPIKNSRTLTSAADNTLYSIIGDKEEGSVLLFDKSLTPNLCEVQVDNNLNSKGQVWVRVRETNGVIREITKLERGQGISNLNLVDDSFDIKPGTNDQPTELNTEVLVSGETISFSERIKKWITYYSYRPEMFGVIDLEMLGFKDGKLWIHNDSDIRNNFYGTQYTSKLELVSNIHPGQVKVFQAIGIESYHAWEVPSMKTPNGMETIIAKARFVRKEDSFFASVMRDINTPNIPSENEGLINGRELRDRTATILLESDDTEEVTLFSTSIQHTISPRHQK
jgi:hypothetical protein